MIQKPISTTRVAVVPFLLVVVVVVVVVVEDDDEEEEGTPTSKSQDKRKLPACDKAGTGTTRRKSVAALMIRLSHVKVVEEDEDENDPVVDSAMPS